MSIDRKYLYSPPKLFFFFVLICHLIVIFFSSHAPSVHKKSQTPLMTYIHPPPPPSTPLPPPNPSKRLTPKKLPPKAAPRKKSPLKKSPFVAKPKAMKKRQVLEKIGQALDKIPHKPCTMDEKKEKREEWVTIPRAPLSLEIDKCPQKQPEDRDLFLVNYLRSQLILPEQGEVTIEITIVQGKLSSMQILSSNSQENAAYLEKTLPLLSFPKTIKRVTRTFVFCNENTSILPS